eukprot:TRINITY_DN23097_c0_g1_i2.p1 TRINITY_DN23097_c0_g1~~TRINITY_DN23097_c0_g1_i2.p1  ORF type:complete len:177 (-),score=27.40 TRINITY_DN23097_c0_g1_i2:91-621(-)
MTAEPGRIFVGGISWKADEQSLTKFFSTFGKVNECKIVMDKNTKKSKGYGFVTFEDPASAEKVKQSNNLYFLGKMMNVGDAVRKDGGNAQPRGNQQRGEYRNFAETPNGYLYDPQNFYVQQYFPPGQFAYGMQYGQAGFQPQGAWQPMTNAQPQSPGQNTRYWFTIGQSGVFSLGG